MTNLFLTDENIALRPVELADLKGPYAAFINDQHCDYFTEHAVFPHSLESLKMHAESKWQRDDCIWLAIITRKDGRHVGNIELRDIDLLHRNANFHILLEKEAQGKGYGYEAARLLITHGFQRLNLHRISLGVREDNVAAIKLYEKLGFVIEGVQREAFESGGKRYANVMMGLLRRDFQAV